MEALVSNIDIYKNALLKTMLSPIESSSVAYEWRGASITFEPHENIPGAEKYVQHELDWYLSQDLNINGHPGIENNKVWQSCATEGGYVNSNYGWCVFSKENGSQYEHALKALKADPNTRQACMYYTRPSIHKEWNDNVHAKHDMICTCYTSSLLRNGLLEHHVHMRSNDAWYGLRNDLAWQQYIQEKLANDLGVECGQILWFADSLHIYKNTLNKVKEFLV